MNRLKELRQEKKLTQQELADIVAVTKRTYIYWEKGDRQIKPDKAQKLADFFEVSVGYLLGYSDKIKVDLTDWELTTVEGLEEFERHVDFEFLKRQKIELEKPFSKFLKDNFLTLSDLEIDFVMSTIINCSMQNKKIQNLSSTSPEF